MTDTSVSVLFAFLFVANAIAAFADPARVVSKQENIPDGKNTKTRVFLDITPNNGDDRADAYVDITRTNQHMSLQEFSDMIQIVDIIEYDPDFSTHPDGRYLVIPEAHMLDLSRENIFKIFL